MCPLGPRYGPCMYDTLMIHAATTKLVYEESHVGVKLNTIISRPTPLKLPSRGGKK
jgi:hypothetical protein